MKNQQQQLEDLVRIRIMMEKSTRFLSLSGLSGVFAGVYALAGAYIANAYMESGEMITGGETVFEQYSNFIWLALVVLVLSVVTAIIFSMRNAKKAGDKIWNSASRRLAINMAIPLAAGGIFCYHLLLNGHKDMIASAMLIFYGLALINGSKYTLDDIRQLGICEVVLGLTALFMPGFGLYFWAVGFGFLHIIYGIVMHFKYNQ